MIVFEIFPHLASIVRRNHASVAKGQPFREAIKRFTLVGFSLNNCSKFWITDVLQHYVAYKSPVVRHPSTKIDYQVSFQCTIAECLVKMKRPLSELPNVHLQFCCILSPCPLMCCSDELFSQAALSEWCRDDEALQIAIAVSAHRAES